MDEPYNSTFKFNRQFRIQFHLQSIDGLFLKMAVSSIIASQNKYGKKKLCNQVGRKALFRSFGVPEKCHGKLIIGYLKVFARDENRKLHKNTRKLSEDQLQITNDIHRAKADEAVLKN